MIKLNQENEIKKIFLLYEYNHFFNILGSKYMQ